LAVRNVDFHVDVFRRARLAYANPRGVFPRIAKRIREAIVRRISSYLTVLVAALGVVTTACESGGVGDPCIPEDEYRQNFPGFNKEEVNVESRSFQCETRVCLVANFQGRVSCPYGTKGGTCSIPGTDGSQAEDQVDPSLTISPQLEARRPEDAVYCSCRCAGPDPNAQYCECPSGFSCNKLVDDLGQGSKQLAGSYCVRNGTFVADNPKLIPDLECNAGAQNCGDANPYGVSR
jgi:hypothetical protein